MNKKIHSLFKHSVFVIFLALTSLNLMAASSPQSNNTSDLTVSLGNLCEYIGKIQTDEKGSTNLCSFMPTLSSSIDYFVYPELALSPQIGATLPKSGRDENISRMTMFVLMNLKYKASFMNFIVGTGLYFTRVSGEGGEAILNNGNSTESFPLPKDAVYSRNIILNLGGSYDFNKEWSGELYTYVFNLESSEDRAFSVGAALTYHFGEVL